MQKQKLQLSQKAWSATRFQQESVQTEPQLQKLNSVSADQWKLQKSALQAAIK